MVIPRTNRPATAASPSTIKDVPSVAEKREWSDRTLIKVSIPVVMIASGRWGSSWRGSARPSWR